MQEGGVRLLFFIVLDATESHLVSGEYQALLSLNGRHFSRRDHFVAGCGRRKQAAQTGKRPLSLYGDQLQAD
jgi:hypothetical protein